MRRLRVRDGEAFRAWRFDLMMNVRRFADGDTVADNYSAAVVELPVRFDGRIGFGRRGFLRHPVVPDLPVAAVGSRALDRRYEVRASSPELAASVLTDPLGDWLCGGGGSFHYELVHNDPSTIACISSDSSLKILDAATLNPILTVVDAHQEGITALKQVLPSDRPPWL